MVKNNKKRFYTVHVIEKSLVHHVIEWLASILSILGALLNANIFNIHSFNPYFASFYVWVVSDILWISFAIKHKHWGVLATFTAFGIINLLAILKNIGIFA